MKYDELDKLEVNSYPNENVVKEGKKMRQKRERKDHAKTINATLFVSSVAAGAACATLLSTVISLAVSGELTTVFQSLLM